ncbi:MAG: hypothetical protein AB4372_34670, partial [Xenococcus sp. (in: cyanobacteria)]
GEDVMAAQERAVKAVEPVNTADDTIAIEAQSEITDINSGISDFSSAVDLDLKAEEAAVEILSTDSDSSKDKTKIRKTKKKSQYKAKKKSSTRQSKSNSRTKKDLTANKKSTIPIDTQQSATDKSVQKVSHKKERQSPKEEQKPRGSIGLPKWKPPSR